MKKFYYTLLLCAITLISHAEIDTLRHYDPNKSIYPSTLSGDIWIRQFAKFYPPAPGYIKSIIITTKNSAPGGSVKVHLFGNEGGVPHAFLEKDLIPPVVITNTVAGIEKIQIDLPDPLFYDGDQLSVGFDEFKGGIAIANSSENPSPFCENHGEEFLFYYQEDGTTKPTSKIDNFWADPFPCVIDLVIDYPTLTSSNYFEEVTTKMGVDTSLIIDWLGINFSNAVADYDNDGWEDLLIDGTLYHNENGHFKEVNDIINVKKPDTLYSNIFIDMNNDGCADILFLSIDGTAGPGLFNLNFSGYINNGGTSFTPFMANVFTMDKILTSINVADFNRDGYPDLFLGFFSSIPTNPNEKVIGNKLLYNDQNLSFTNESSRIPGSNNPCRASRCADYDNDGYVDIYVCNFRLVRDELWKNNGDGSFTNVAIIKGIDSNKIGSNNGTGVDWKDFDNDGDLDILVSRLAHPNNVSVGLDHRPTTIYENSGYPDFNFIDKELATGIEYEERHMAASWGDVNNDGLMDVFTTTQFECHYNDLYIQNADHTYKNHSFEYGIHKSSSASFHGSDALWVDIDKNGTLDLITNEKQRIAIYNNTTPRTNNWVSLKLKAISLNKLGLGSRVKVFSDGQVYMQEVNSGGSRLYQNSTRLHFGMGQANTIDSVVVTWPNNTKEKFTGLGKNKYYTLEEGGKITVGDEDFIQESDVDLKIFPNPSNGGPITLLIDAPETISNLKIMVSDILGKEFSTPIMDKSFTEGRHSIQLNHRLNLKTGVYLVHFEMDGERQVRKLVVN